MWWEPAEAAIAATASAAAAFTSTAARGFGTQGAASTDRVVTPGLSLAASDDVSISIWCAIEPLASQQQANGKLLTWATGSQGVIDFQLQGASDGRLRTRRTTDGTTRSWEWTLAFDLSAQHFLAVYDGTAKTWAAWLDGTPLTPDSTTAGTGNDLTTTEGLHWGNRSDGTRVCDCVLDECVVWKGLKLTGTNATFLAGGGDPAAIATPSAWCRMGEASGDDAILGAATITGTTSVSPLF